MAIYKGYKNVIDNLGTEATDPRTSPADLLNHFNTRVGESSYANRVWLLNLEFYLTRPIDDAQICCNREPTREVDADPV